MRKNAITLQAFVLLIRNYKIIAEAVFIMDWGPSICCIANRTFPLCVHFRYWFLTHLALIFLLLLNTMRQILCACPISVSEESIQILWKSAVAVLFTIRSRAPSLSWKNYWQCNNGQKWAYFYNVYCTSIFIMIYWIYKMIKYPYKV